MSRNVTTMRSRFWGPRGQIVIELMNLSLRCFPVAKTKQGRRSNSRKAVWCLHRCVQFKLSCARRNRVLIELSQASSRSLYSMAAAYRL